MTVYRESTFEAAVQRSLGAEVKGEHMKVFKEFRFEAAHSLPHLPEGHKCRNVHGHSYLVRVTVSGKPVDGMVIDYAEISRAWLPLYAVLDHQNIDGLPGLGHSTSENLARWIYDLLRKEVDNYTRDNRGGAYVSSVEVRETPSAGAIYP